MAGGESVTAEGLTRRADLAMYEAKSRSGSSVAVFEPELKRVADRRLRVELDLDGLKIDRSFIGGVAREERGRKFVRSIVDLAHELGLEVVTEGVEDEADRDVLRRMGVTRAQGYLWSEPRWPGDIPDAD